MDINKKVWQRGDYFIAFGFGLGTLPIAPGTWGTLAGIPFVYLFSQVHWVLYLLLTVLLFVLGVWVSDRVSKDIGVHDHQGIVWDEVVGYILTMFLVKLTLLSIVLGFVLFRIFDILKPPPVNYCDEHIKGGLGIMLDDIGAAIYAWACLHIILFFI